jgi:hypothetical protein
MLKSPNYNVIKSSMTLNITRFNNFSLTTKEQINNIPITMEFSSITKLITKVILKYADNTCKKQEVYKLDTYWKTYIILGDLSNKSLELIKEKYLHSIIRKDWMKKKESLALNVPIELNIQ